MSDTRRPPLPMTDGQGRAFAPFEYEPPKGWSVIGSRHCDNPFTKWDYRAGWDHKLVEHHRQSGAFTALNKIPGTCTSVLLYKPAAPKAERTYKPVRHGK